MTQQIRLANAAHCAPNARINRSRARPEHPTVPDPHALVGACGREQELSVFVPVEREELRADACGDGERGGGCIRCSSCREEGWGAEVEDLERAIGGA